MLRVGTMGAEKYTYGGFLEVENGVRRYTAAMQRHYFAEEIDGIYDQDPYYDTPEGAKWKNQIRHDAQVLWNAAARLELRLREEASRDAITIVDDTGPYSAEEIESWFLPREKMNELRIRYPEIQTFEAIDTVDGPPYYKVKGFIDPDTWVMYITEYVEELDASAVD